MVDNPWVVVFVLGVATGLWVASVIAAVTYLCGRDWR
jgi:hypothetical protein